MWEVLEEHEKSCQTTNRQQMYTNANVVVQIDNGKYIIFLDKAIPNFVTRWVHIL